LQRAVIEHLELRGVFNLFYTFFPAGGWRSRVEAAIFRGLGLKAGVPDILLIYRSRIYALELKVEGTGKLSKKQIETHQLLRMAGAIVATAWGVDQALAQIETWGLVSNKSRGAQAGNNP
jgi:hypothetical protein